MAAIAGWITSIWIIPTLPTPMTSPMPGTTIIDEHHAPRLEEIHESPKVMLVPLALLAIGAVFAGMAFFHYFIGEGAHEFWRASIFVGAGEEGHLPVWVELAPLTVTIIGFAGRLLLLHPASRPAARSWPTAGACSTCSSTTNGTSTSSTTSSLCAPPSMLGRFLWKRGDGTIIDGLGPDGIAARVLDASPRRGAAADRLRLSLCPGDAAGRGGAGHLVCLSDDGRRAVSLPLLSLVTFVPLIGAAAILAAAATPAARAGSR